MQKVDQAAVVPQQAHTVSTECILCCILYNIGKVNTPLWCTIVLKLQVLDVLYCLPSIPFSLAILHATISIYGSETPA
jgi:hypothetical protein